MISQPKLHAAQTNAESGYTSAFTDASANLPDRSETVLHVPKCQRDIARNNSPSDKKLEISIVPPVVRCPLRIN